MIKGRRVDLPQRPEVSTSRPNDTDERKGISISATIASKGGGKTWIKCWFGTDDFTQIAEAMVLADPCAAKSAFESAIVNPNRASEENHRKYLERELSKMDFARGKL